MELRKAKPHCRFYGKGETKVKTAEGVSFGAEHRQMAAIIGACGFVKLTLEANGSLKEADRNEI